jgi:asparagine synthase (glutamine-hydrolysing)
MSSINLEKTRQFVVNRFKEPKSDNIIDRALYTDLKLYMPDQILTLSDRLSMCHSLEIRVPLADKEVITHCANINSSYKIKGLKSKFLLKNIAERFIPQSIITHRKQGFEPPMAGWLKHELKDLLIDTLSKENLNQHNFFRYEQVKNLIDEHMTGKRKNNKILFCLLMFQLWYQRNATTFETSE